MILRSPARRISVRADATNATSDDGGDGKEPLLGTGRSDGRASNANVGAQRTGSSSRLEKRTTEEAADARNRDGDGRSSDTLAIEKRRENTTAIAPVIANDSSTEDEGRDEKAAGAEPAGRRLRPSQTAPRLALSEESCYRRRS